MKNRIVIFLLCSSLGLLGGCGYDGKDKTQFDKAEKLFSEDKHKNALQEYKLITTGFPKSELIEKTNERIKECEVEIAKRKKEREVEIAKRKRQKAKEKAYDVNQIPKKVLIDDKIKKISINSLLEDGVHKKNKYSNI